MPDTTAAEGSAAHDRTVTEVSLEATGGAGLGGTQAPGESPQNTGVGLGDPGVARVAGPVGRGVGPPAP